MATRGFEYTTDPNFDYTIDEKGNTFIALRKIDWGNNGNYKLDLRKYYASESGETMSKGVSFLTDEGPDELTKVLVETGYGNDEELVNAIIENRPYILGRIKAELDNNSDLVERIKHERLDIIEDDDDFYDPEELLG